MYIIAETKSDIPKVKNKGQFIFPFLYAYYYELEDKDFIDLFLKVSHIPVLEVTQTSNYTKLNIERWVNYIDTNLL